MITIEIKAPYLIFVGSETDPGFAKTGCGLVEWRPDLCKGQLSLIDDGVDLGLPKLSLEEAKEQGINTLIVGLASVGGVILEEWRPTLMKAAELGFDIAAGVHQRLDDIPELQDAANKSGAKLIDVRTTPENIPVSTGKKRTGKRLLTVGTDCVSGKKFTALSLERDMKKLGINVDFRASGQTGIMIAGKGIPIDSVVSDFVSGAAELLSPDNSDDHWDIIEGQGGIIHPGYAAVSMGLLIGSQLDCFVVCHDATRTDIDGWEDFKLSSIEDIIKRTTDIGSLTNPDIKCIGISINTSGLDENERESYKREVSTRLGLPCVDPFIDGTEALIDNLNSQ